MRRQRITMLVTLLLRDALGLLFQFGGIRVSHGFATR
jgi:hypothetical protein